jgi:HlyD family secretion protein
MAGTEMMRIADENNIVVRAEISEPDILKISKGQEAEIITDAYPDIKLKGLVTQILPLQPKKEISLGDQIANYVVEISIAPASYSNLIKDGEKNPFIPGMPASVDIVTQVIQNTLGISIVAVTSREIHTSEDTTFVGSSKELLQNENNAHPVNDGNLGEVVFAVSGDSVLMVDVKTGIQDSEYIQIVSGLKEGQEVVIGPYSTISKKLANGTKIKRIRQ